jgi:hypothetical protein
MRQTAKQGDATILTDTSHRFHCDMNRILTQHIKQDMPEMLQISMEPVAFWEKHMEAGVCTCILETSLELQITVTKRPINALIKTAVILVIT